MKVYCSCCEKVQPVIIDNCRDAKTNEPFQDIVCKECHLVIAAGTDIEREWAGLTDEEIDKTYETQIWDTRRSYARAIEAKLKEKNTP
jgi:uncharacterized protein YlaI